MAIQSYSIVEYYAEHEGYKCGYCKSPDTNFSHGKYKDKYKVYFALYNIKCLHVILKYFKIVIFITNYKNLL